MFKIQYDLESFRNDLENLNKLEKIGDWYFNIVGNPNNYFIELKLKNNEFGDAGFFEVKENRYFLEFRFFFYDNDDDDGYKSQEYDEEVYSFYYGRLVRFILSRIIKNGEQITIFKG